MNQVNKTTLPLIDVYGKKSLVTSEMVSTNKNPAPTCCLYVCEREELFTLQHRPRRSPQPCGRGRVFVVLS